VPFKICKGNFQLLSPLQYSSNGKNKSNGALLYIRTLKGPLKIIIHGIRKLGVDILWLHILQGRSITFSYKNHSHYTPEVPRGFQEVKVPRLRDNGPGWW